MSDNDGRSGRSNSRDNRGGGKKPGRSGASGARKSSGGSGASGARKSSGGSKPSGGSGGGSYRGGAGGRSQGGDSRTGGSSSGGGKRSSGSSSSRTGGQGGSRGTGSGSSARRSSSSNSSDSRSDSGRRDSRDSRDSRGDSGRRDNRDSRSSSSGRSDSRDSRSSSSGRSDSRDSRDGARRDVRSSGGDNRGRRDEPRGDGPRYKSGIAAQLPHWLVEDLQRTTPPARVGPALESFGRAVRAFEEGKYRPSLRHAKAAKDAAPRSAPVREVVGLAAYRAGDWQTALTELRAYRRMCGDTAHMAIEMDVMRALGRGADIEKTYKELEQRGGHPAAVKEGRVVYASYLIDEGRAQDAWNLVEPKRIEPGGHDGDRRLWYVAARAAALLGDQRTAGQLRDAILLDDPGFPGIDELETLIRRSNRGS